MGVIRQHRLRVKRAEATRGLKQLISKRAVVHTTSTTTIPFVTVHVYEYLTLRGNGNW